MFNLDIPDIFGTLSIGIFGLIVLLMVRWILTQEPDSFLTWIQNQPILKDRKGRLFAPLFFLLFGFGAIIENFADHLTDSRKADWKLAFTFESVRDAIPALQTYILQKESHYRFVTLFENCKQVENRKQGKLYALSGLGREYFKQHGEELKRIAAGDEDFESLIDKIKCTTQKPCQDNTPGTCKCFKEQEEHALKFANKIYYTAKNWAYEKATYYDELQSIQRHIEYTRSGFLIASWGVCLVLLAFFVSIGKCWIGGSWYDTVYLLVRQVRRIVWPILLLIVIALRIGGYWRDFTVYPWRRQVRRTICLIILLVVISYLGMKGYEYAAIQFNERALGYYSSFLHRNPTFSF